MIFFIGFTYITLMQWYHQYRRRQMYMSVFSRALRRSSILAQRVCSTQQDSVGDLLHSPLLNSSHNYNLQQNINDGNLLISTVEPKQTVDMQSWTAYMDVHPTSDQSSQNILVLLEADQPTDVIAYQKKILNIPEVCRVHVLKHGCPVAWRPGLPFGIVLHCSLDGLVTICDAFGQGHLVVGENLEINKIITIQSHGKPHTFLQESECQESSVDDADKIPGFNSPEKSSKNLKARNEDSNLVDEKVKDMKVKTFTDRDATSKDTDEYVMAANGVHTEGVSLLNANTNMKAENVSIKSVNIDSVKMEEKSLKNTNPDSVKTDVGVKNVKTDREVVSHPNSSTDSVKTDDGHHTDNVKTEDVVIKDANTGPKNGDIVSTSSVNVTGTKTESMSVNGVNKESMNTDDINKDGTSINKATADSTKPESASINNAKAESVKTNCTNADSTTPEGATINKAKAESVKTNGTNADSTTPEGASINKAKAESVKTNGTNADSTTPEGASINNAKAEGVKTNGTGTDSTNGCDSGLKMSNTASNAMKPPNVLIYCGKKDSVRRFQIVKASLEQCLNTDCYTIYHMQHSDVNATPWADNTALLLVSCESLYDGISIMFSKYFKNGGKILSFGSPLDGEFVERKKVQDSIGLTELDIETWKGVSTLRGPYNYVGCSTKMGEIVLNTMARDQATGDPVLMFVRHKSESDSTGVAVLSQLLLERDPTELVGDPKQFKHLKKSNSTRIEILKHILITLGLDCSQQTPPDLTPCILFTNKQDIKKAFMDSIQQRLKSGILRSRTLTLEFMEKAKPSTQVKPLHLPVLTDDCEQTVKYFQPHKYWQHLETACLGQVLLYTDVIPTTMTLFEGLQFSLKKHVGVIAVAGRQTAGKGRGSNTWISPVGCAMFSLHVRVPMDSNLGRKVSFLQHIASLAVVNSVCSMPGYENIDLRLKWPNDIYYGKDIKLGGVIVNSSIMGKVVHAVIGCGFNVDNGNPTVCINDLIQQHNIQHNTKLDLCSIEQLIARTVTITEQLINIFQKEDQEAFCQMYYEKWLHSGVKVGLESEGGMEATVCGLDDYGYLQVEMADGQKLSVQPDGNSFDMMHNLILIKRR